MRTVVNPTAVRMADGASPSVRYFAANFPFICRTTKKKPRTARRAGLMQGKQSYFLFSSVEKFNCGASFSPFSSSVEKFGGALLLSFDSPSF